MDTTGTETTLASFLAAGHRLCRNLPSEPYGWLRPGQDPPTTREAPRNGCVNARLVEALRRRGLVEGTQVTVNDTTGSIGRGLTWEVVEATQECVRLFGKRL